MEAVVLMFVFLAIASCWMVVRDTGMEREDDAEEEKDGRRKRKKIRKATVVDVYEYFILLRIKTKIAGNSFCESLSWQEFEMMRR